jgi:hypothetical protein
MAHPRYSVNDGLIGMSLDERIALLDDLFAPEVSTAVERRELRLHDELLASQAEFFARYWNLVKDCNGGSYVPLKRGKRAYSPEELLQFLRGEPSHLQLLVSLAREALRSRPEADDEWPLSLQMCAPGEVPDITAEALRGLSLFERLQLGSNLPYAVGLRAEAIAPQRLSGTAGGLSLHDLDALLCEDDVAALAEIVRPYLSSASAAP